MHTSSPLRPRAVGDLSSNNINFELLFFVISACCMPESSCLSLCWRWQVPVCCDRRSPRDYRHMAPEVSLIRNLMTLLPRYELFIAACSGIPSIHCGCHIIQVTAETCATLTLKAGRTEPCQLSLAWFGFALPWLSCRSLFGFPGSMMLKLAGSLMTGPSQSH